MNREPQPPRNATDARTPWVKLRSVAYRPFIYRKMVQAASPEASAGDVVTVLDKHGEVFGSGLYNPRSEIVLRMLVFGSRAIDDQFWAESVEHAVALRRDVLKLDRHTSAYRVIHAEGDGLSGLVVDRYAEVLAFQAHSLGIAGLLPKLIPIVHRACGTRYHTVGVDDRVRKAEGIKTTVPDSADLPRSVKVSENGVRFKVRFDIGHKTGFFCDQRDNRLKLAGLTDGADVLDACCYGGGFGIYAKVKGQAAQVTCVDLDEEAIAMARQNMNLNSVRVNLVQADVFPYLRQMQTNHKLYDVVVLDPPKLVFGRSDTDDGRKKYYDLNRLAIAVVKPGGLLVSCSCSGAVCWAEFMGIVSAAARSTGKTIQYIDRSGAAGDHPVRPDAPESEYLKVAWMRLT
ncbi:MAG: class I SAM-dependent rRNA methyltransferase [Phycisphaerae bacterium]|nr:class I SAM-dependent rRNA methyltransferase [Phycisphaerae bacterium]